MTSQAVPLVALAMVISVLSGCGASRTTNGGPYVFEGASDVASVAHLTGCVRPVGSGADDSYMSCNEGSVSWSGGGADDPSSIRISAPGMAIYGASFEIQCNETLSCRKAFDALLAWVSPIKRNARRPGGD